MLVQKFMELFYLIDERRDFGDFYQKEDLGDDIDFYTNEDAGIYGIQVLYLCEGELEDLGIGNDEDVSGENDEDFYVEEDLGDDVNGDTGIQDLQYKCRWGELLQRTPRSSFSNRIPPSCFSKNEQLSKCQNSFTNKTNSGTSR